MASEVRDVGQPDNPATILKDAHVMNAVVRLLVAFSGVGCVGLAGYQALHASEALVTASFLAAALILLVLALAAEPTTRSS
jgi:hypothetical protein